MKQRKFFARLGSAVEVILRDNMKPQLGNIALPRKADKISQAEECYQTIGSAADTGNEGGFYFDLPVISKD